MENVRLYDVCTMCVRMYDCTMCTMYDWPGKCAVSAHVAPHVPTSALQPAAQPSAAGCLEACCTQHAHACARVHSPCTHDSACGRAGPVSQHRADVTNAHYLYSGFVPLWAPRDLLALWFHSSIGT
eukprot:351856-Chlamydomonas_euryale.AAC.2